MIHTCLLFTTEILIIIISTYKRFENYQYLVLLHFCLTIKCNNSSSESSHGLESVFKMEIDDDESSTFCPEEMNGRQRRTDIAGKTSRNTRKKKSERVVHQCDQCDAKYTSISKFISFCYVPVL